MSLILGVDHICVTGANSSQCLEFLLAMGGTVKFQEDSLPVSPEKLQFVREPCERHNIILVTYLNQLSIEVIQHRSSYVNAKLSPYNVCWESNLSNYKTSENSDIGKVGVALTEALGGNAARHVVPELDLTYFQIETSSNNSSGVATVALEYLDIDQGLCFWKNGLGFKTLRKSVGGIQSWTLLHYSSPILSWNLQVLLIEAGQSCRHKAYIDDYGWTCISFLVLSIEKTIEALMPYGIKDIGDPHSLYVGGKKIHLCFFRGPGDELIEIIQLERR